MKRIKGKKSLVVVSVSAKRGFQKAFALGGYHIEFPEQNYILRDSIAIMSDWEEIGNELYKAQEKYKRTEFRKTFACEE